MTEPLLIRGGSVVTDGASTRADVLIRGRRIAAVGSAEELPAAGCRLLDASDCLVLPGGVDAHTHILGRVQADGVAALCGGTTTALAFVDAEPGETPTAAAHRTIAEQLDNPPIDVGLHGVVWEPERYRPGDVAALAELGVTSVKLWLAYPELGIMADDAQAFAVIAEAARERAVVQAHCENGGMIATLGAQLRSERRLGLEQLPRWRPAVAEAEAVHRFLAMAELAGAEAYVVHVSGRRPLREIDAARQRGVAATAETCTHHLAFDDSVYAGAGAIRYLVAPPLRPASDVAALWEALADGHLDVLASDHGHDSLEPDKRVAADDITRVPLGLPGIELRLPVAFTLGVGEGRISAERLVEVACAAPARAYGLFPRKGTIRPGADADVLIWDPVRPWTVGPDTRHDGLDYSPYDGLNLIGVARIVIAGGEVVVKGRRVHRARLPRALPGPTAASSTPRRHSTSRTPHEGGSIPMSHTGPRTIIAHGTVAAEYGMFRAHVVIDGERISGLSDDDALLQTADEVIDASGTVILPGAIDPHAHFEDPGHTEREDFTTGTMAAAAGGITTVIEHPLTYPPVTTVDLYTEKREMARAKVVVDFGLWGALTAPSLSHIEGQWAEGASGFKAFMPESDPSYPHVTDAEFLEGMEIVRRLGGLVLVHAESDALLRANRTRLQHAGRTDVMAHPESRPPFVEEEAVHRALYLAWHSGVRIQIVHSSSPVSVDLVTEARARGQRASAEVCPHHLLLDMDDYRRLGPYGCCAPAIRDRALVEEMWRRVLAGQIDCLVSDHAAYTIEEKEAGRQDMLNCPLGCQVIQETVPLVFSEAIHRRGMTLPAFAKFSSTNAARIIGLYPRKGTILPGSDADLALYDLEREWVVDSASQQFSKNPWSPFDGRGVRGQLVRTIVRGRTVYCDGEITAQPGSGRFLSSQGAAPSAMAPSSAAA